ncbi:zinc-dependent alcohol dehydrogenase [Shouchella shacheensis]|uniref:zinc-dependent alcohol dehydrogenase n=1 Tax=Shouchella shacheensis TaxID=1649580 RepID=UPI00073FAFD1|nr:alcohol dehydrogenase catalytic domain-containing protein [Shouchella shacheensis]
MLGLILKNPGELELTEQLSTARLTDTDVKIRLLYGGICGSDLSVYRGKLTHASYPVIPGHELLGEVIDKGADVTTPIGSRVVVMPNSFCAECEWCKKGKTNVCPHKASLGINIDGGFAQEFVISSRYVLPIPASLPSERAVLVEPFAVIVHALRKVNIEKGTSVAVIGCGTEGLLAVTLAHHLGANLCAIDINMNKLEKVKTIDPGIQVALPHEVGHSQFDVVIEAAGVKSSVEQSVEIVKPGGNIVLVGMTAEANFPIMKIVRNEISIHGSIIYQFPTDFEKAAQYLANPSFNINDVISKIVPFKEYQLAYDEALTGEYGKIILDFREDVHV